MIKKPHNKKLLSIPEQHQLRIAKDSLKMTPIGASIMGMDHNTAKEIIFKLTGRHITE